MDFGRAVAVSCANVGSGLSEETASKHPLLAFLLVDLFHQFFDGLLKSSSIMTKYTLMADIMIHHTQLSAMIVSCFSEVGQHP